MWDEPSQCYFFHNQALQPLLFGKDVMIWGAETVDGMFRCPSLRCWIWKLHQSNSINIEWDIPCDLCLCIIYYPYVICVSCAFGLYTICIDTYGHGYSEFCLCTKDIFYIHTAIDMTHIYIYLGGLQRFETILSKVRWAGCFFDTFWSLCFAGHQWMKGQWARKCPIFLKGTNGY